MKDLDQAPEQIAHEVVVPVKTESKKILSKPLRKGQFMWEFDLQTHVGKPVQAKYSELLPGDNNKSVLRHHIEYRKDRYYCIAINLTNAMRKYRKWFIANQNAMRIMALRKPKPESPSVAASQSE
jgi:hypothetical protein